MIHSAQGAGNGFQEGCAQLWAGRSRRVSGIFHVQEAFLESILVIAPPLVYESIVSRAGDPDGPSDEFRSRFPKGAGTEEAKKQFLKTTDL